MHAVTSLMRVQQLVLGRLDAILRPHGLTFARYEALVLLCFSSRGSLPLGKMGERLQVHPTSITSIVQRLEADGLVRGGRTPRTAARSWPRSPRPVARWSRWRPPSWSALTSRWCALRRPARRAVRPARAGTPGGRRLRAEPRDHLRRRTPRGPGPAPRLRAWRCAGRWKLKVKQIVFVAFSRDETEMGFGFPKAERDGLVASDPDTFFLPRHRRPALPVGVRPPRPARATRRCASWSPTPGGCARRRCSTSCPSCPAPAARVWDLVDAAGVARAYARCCTLTSVSTTATWRCAGAPGARPSRRAPDPSAADGGRGAGRAAVPLGAGDRSGRQQARTERVLEMARIPRQVPPAAQHEQLEHLR